MKTLYLGLVNHGLWKECDHLPLIEIKYFDFSEKQLKSIGQSLDDSSIWVITSQSTVSWLDANRNYIESINDLSKKLIIATGPATGLAVKKVLSSDCVIPDAYTQEGIIELLSKKKPNSVVWLRSDKARPGLGEFLKNEVCCLSVYDIYTVRSKVMHDPNRLLEYDQLVFTSPSTVESFIEQVPQPKHFWRYIPIGPVTKNAIQDAINNHQLVGEIVYENLHIKSL